MSTPELVVGGTYVVAGAPADRTLLAGHLIRANWMRHTNIRVIDGTPAGSKSYTRFGDAVTSRDTDLGAAAHRLDTLIDLRHVGTALLVVDSLPTLADGYTLRDAFGRPPLDRVDAGIRAALVHPSITTVLVTGDFDLYALAAEDPAAVFIVATPGGTSGTVTLPGHPPEPFSVTVIPKWTGCL